MTPETKKWAWAAGIAAGATALVGAIVLWPKKAQAATRSPTPPRERQIGMPARDGDSLAISFGDRVLVTFTEPLPPGYIWTTSFAGDYVADIAKSPYQLGPRKILEGEEAGKSYTAYDEYTVVSRGRGTGRISFAAYKVDAHGSPDPQAQVFAVNFSLTVS